MSELQQEIARLETELAALKKKIAPKVVSVDEGARISYPVARLDDLPNEKQCQALLKIVTARHPILAFPKSMTVRWGDTDERAFFDGFSGSLAWCDLAATRVDYLDRRYDVRHWKDECSMWCRAQRLTAPDSVGVFMAAAIASHVKYSSLHNFPYDLALGIAHYGRVVRGGWRPTLTNGPAEPMPTPGAAA